VPLNASSEFVARYGRYGLDASGAATKAMWSNATMTPDVPTAAHVLAQLWEGAGHEKVDGVFLIDPAGLAALLRATGPITVEGLPSPLDSSNLERFLFLDQYSLDTVQRRDLLAQVAQATIDALLGGHLPAPQILARDLGSAATSGHIVGWAKRPEEQAMLRLIGMDAALPALEGRDGLAVVTNNASANKIDTFLRRTVRYDATVHHGVVTATLTTTLHNTAPATGYPDYVIGSEFLHMPIGTNRTLLTVYSPLEFTAAMIDDVDTGLTSDTELGWNAYTTQLDVAPGATRVVVVRLTGRLTADSYSLVLRPQTLANPDNVSIQVSGDTHVSYIGTPTRRTIVDAHGAGALR
jgi:Protein of unknown function (DUF4012)